MQSEIMVLKRMGKKVVLLAMLLAMASYGQAQEQKPVALFTVGQTPVYTDEFIYVYRKNHQNKPEALDEKNINEYLDLFVNFKLKVAEAHARGLDTTRKFVNEFKTYREELKKPYRTEPDALDKLTKDTYQRLTEEVRAAHILINVKPDASPADTLAAWKKIAQIRERVSKGEDFEKVAREVSEDPSARYNGGDLNYFTAMQMVYPFEEAAYNTRVNEISPITRTRFGYHLVKVKDRKPARGEVEVSHVLLRTGAGNDAAVKNKIFDIYDQLKAGRSWDELCKEFSEDPNTKNTGGKLRPFGVGAMASVPEFEAMAFSLQAPGDVSDPFQSAVGWHIIRLEKKIPLPSYKEMEASLKRRVARDERLQLSQQALNEKRKREYALKENEPVKARVMAMADSTLTQGKWKATASADLKKETLFSVEQKNVTAGEFISFVQTTQTPSSLLPTPFLKQLYELFVEEKILEAEESKLLKTQPDFRNLLTEYREGILFFEVMEKEVWNKASADTIGQRAFYEKNKARYPGGDRVQARIFSATNKSVIEAMKASLQAGDTLTQEQLKKFKSVQNLRSYEKGESKIVDKVPASVGVHETEADGLFYLVEIKQLIPPGIKSFEEARASVISDYQDSVEKNWITALRKKYPVKINKKARKFVLAELKAK